MIKGNDFKIEERDLKRIIKSGINECENLKERDVDIS